MVDDSIVVLILRPAWRSFPATISARREPDIGHMRRPIACALAAFTSSPPADAGRRHLLADDDVKDWFQETLFTVARDFGWTLEAWAILSNHYHLTGHSPKGPDGAESLRDMIRKLHSPTTRELNRRENQPGSTRLWQNFRETRLTHQRSYLARLHYVHQNAVHHKLVAVGSDYKWCGTAEFKQAVTPAWLKTITSFRYDEIAAKDGDD